ncbi:MAG: IS481-like element ISGme9 family transposase, partial [Thermoanaerobaculia bacterium]
SRHNSRWRYRKHSGCTPNQVLANSGVQLRFPTTLEPPQTPLPWPEVGRYHFIRFIRSNGVLDLFGETFRMPGEAQHEYVHATVNVQMACLEVRLDGRLIESFRYDPPRR